MKVVTRIVELRQELKKERQAGRTIGLVPTMGYFHEGHLSLMRQARKECDLVVVSLYVNLLQFGPKEDLKDYPRDFERDKNLAEKEGVNYLFCPADKEMYPNNHLTYVEVEKITEKLCGKVRPGHFKGVTTVCAKLFNIIQPDKAYFGQKDFQQLRVVRKMVKDLNFNLKIVAVPTVRERKGLAMSSRNSYLTPSQSQAALVLSKSLNSAQKMVEAGEQEAEVIKRELLKEIEKEKLVNLEYLSLCDPKNFEEVKRVEKETLLALAAKIGKAQLIDNALLRPKRRKQIAENR